jgi:hypothetical protein
MSETFRTTIIATGKTTCGIKVPDEVVEALGGGRHPKVVATVNHYTYRTSVASMGGGFWFGLTAANRAESGLGAGDEVDVTLQLDTAPREVAVPPELAAALDADPVAKAFFDGLSYSNKRVFTLSVEGTQNLETKARRVEKALALMHEGRVR